MDIIKGINPVIEVLKNSENIEKLEIYKGVNKKTISKVLELASKRNIKIFYTEKRHENSQGVVVHISNYNYYKTLDEALEKTIIKKKSIILVLDQIQDPRNFGAIIRTAECFGIDFIVIQDRNSVKVNETVVKSSTGAIEYVDIVKVVNISDTIQKLQKYGYISYAAEANASKHYKEIEYGDKIVLVVGSEGKGIREKVRNTCDESINIHLKGKINSLNVSSATAILLAEMSKF